MAAGVLLVLGVATAHAQNAPAWNPEAARGYLDGRMSWWTTWPVSARDHQTFCVSCHTVLPYALARPTLGEDGAEHHAAAPESKLLDNVTKRVRLWKEVEPFYPDAQRGTPKTAESRGTESILNALILVRQQGKSPDARLALDNMWAEQLREGPAAGAWNWLQFHNAPWEGDSQYFGATLAALAAGLSGDEAVGEKALREYLLREENAQVPVNRLMLLWASTKLSGLLAAGQQKAIVDEALSKQQGDGGFSLTSLVGDWKRHDGTALETKSDGFATGLVTLALQEAGMPADAPQMERGLAWLRRNQDKAEGRWFAYSLNKQRDLATDVGKFMSDAATAYAVMSLEKAEGKGLSASR